MNAPICNLTTTCSLFPVYDEKPTPALLRGTATFTFSSGTESYAIEASPELDNGVWRYRLTMAGFEGHLQRDYIRIDGTRRYIGYLGSSRELEVDGVLLDQSENTPPHIYLTIIPAAAIYRHNG